MMPESLRFFGGSSSLAMNKRTPMAIMSSAIGTIIFAMLNSTHNSKIVNDQRESMGEMMLRIEEILRMEMIAALSSKVRDGMDSSNGMI